MYNRKASTITLLVVAIICAIIAYFTPLLFDGFVEKWVYVSLIVSILVTIPLVFLLDRYYKKEYDKWHRKD
ncbi:hypothetical protein KDW_41590 [Dictyobacter vulcani]|uniref:Uncharacterized protein n=1 Tax=Dictyobacter vulcani TaxID=2607529 RepID=A0A5J4KU83_9CHLR|nr:hypothetical protein [Dictyobacter vulcani]GER89997.1 hypothetical protein KDW_41590 [Dictyobacter vulcani]